MTNTTTNGTTGALTDSHLRIADHDEKPWSRLECDDCGWRGVWYSRAHREYINLLCGSRRSHDGARPNCPAVRS